MKKFRLLSCIIAIAMGVSFVSPLFALDAAHWLRGTTDWGDFGVAENWAIGSSESEVHKVPGTTEYVHLDGNRKFDLNGGTYTVGGLSTSATGAGGNQGYSIWVTNGTLTVDGYVFTTANLQVFDGSTLILKAADTGRSWGHSVGFFITVHSGGAVEERKALTFQKYQVTIEEGGSFVLAPTTYGPHPSGLITSWYKNSGYMYLPNGIRRNYTYENTPTSPASETFYQYAGTMKIGGPVARGNQAYQPMYFEFHGGTLEAENAVTFANDIKRVKFMEGSAMTVKVDADSSLDLKNVTFADDATITKTGPGKLILRDVAVPSLSVSEGAVEVQSDSVAPTSVSFAADATLRFTVSGFRLDAISSYEGMQFELDPSVVVAGAGVLYSSNADFLAYAKDAIAATLPNGFGATIVGDAVKLTRTSDCMFDASKSSDLSDPTAWKGGVVPVGEDVIVGGAGTVAFTAGAPAFRSVSVQANATLAVTGGTEGEPVDLPKLTLNYDARLLIATDAVAQMTNEFTTVGDAQTLPVLEIATNALLIAQTPNAPVVKCAHNQWSYHTVNHGVTWKNLAFRWYGTIKMFHSDVADRGEQCHLYLGYAAEKETSYIAVDCQGGTYYAAGEGNCSGRCMTGLIIAVPDNDTTDSKDQGGKVIPVGTIRLRDYTFRHQPSASANASYAIPGFFIGKCNPWYTGNPASVEYDVVIEGNTELSSRGVCRIAGGAHVTLRAPASWTYVRAAWSDENIYRSLEISEAGTLSVEGAKLGLCSTDNSWRGLRSNDTVDDLVSLKTHDAVLSLLNWSGSGKTLAEIDGGRLQLGYLRTVDTLAGVSPVFDGFKSVALSNVFAISAADVDRGNASKDWASKNENWDRWVKIGPPLTGTGSLVVSNELSGTHAKYATTVVVTNGANTATGMASAAQATAGGAPAYLLFADGANWAGTVVANAGLSLTNLTDGAAAATVDYQALQLDGNFPIRVWKTGGSVVANDRVNLGSAPTGSGRFVLVAVDEALKTGDVFELGTYPANAALPRVKGCTVSTEPIPGDDEHVTLVVSRGNGLMLLVK